MSAAEGPSFAVNCLGHDGGRGHTEYLFRVRHSGGCEWTVQRRYQDLHDLHERLCAVFGAWDLPEFPPRTSAGGLVGALLGGGSAGSQPNIVAARERAFQKYFDALCDRRDVLRTQCLQVALAVAVPEPVSHLRVRGWVPAPELGQGLTALLDVRPEGQALGSSAVSEAYHVVASLVFSAALAAAAGGSAEELCPVADFRLPAMGTASQARVECLKPGAQVELRVSAANAVGESSPVSIRVVVPCAPADTGHCDAEARREPWLPALHLPAHPEAPLAEPDELASRRAELEREWAERRREAEREDAELRERQMAGFRAQREELERQQEALDFERQLTGLSSRAASDGARSPPDASPVASPREFGGGGFDGFALTSPREEYLLQQALRATGEAQQLREQSEAQQEELDRRGRELRELQAEREATMERSAQEQRAEREALEREREELQLQREELREAAAASEAACAARGGELAELQAALARQRAEVEGSRAAEEAERVGRLEGLLEAQAQLDERKAELLREQAALEASRRGQAEELREAEAELLRRADRLARTEQALDFERRELTRSRASLAMVQAHVVSMLDKALPGSQGTATHRLDEVDADEPLEEEGADPDGEDAAGYGGSDDRGPPRDASVDGVWAMDWTAGFPDRLRERESPTAVEAGG